jgi:dUTP pyrophosphatase
MPAGRVEAQGYGRAAASLEFGVTVLNAPGTIDADYRGEIKVILVNLGGGPFEIRDGDRIAQMVFRKTLQAAWREVGSLPATGRGDNGFGSTGRR